METPRGGLIQYETVKQLAIFGDNEITEENKNPFLEFPLRYWCPMPWLLDLAMGLSFSLHHTLDGIIIFTLPTVNTAIGHPHSRGLQRAAELLNTKLAIKAKVLWGGK